MVRKICLDSDVIIGFLNKNEKSNYVIKNLEAEFCITTINSFEVWFGRKNNELIFEFLGSFDVFDFDNKSALLAGDILRDLKNKGELLDMRDVFIAAVCIANNLELLTFNKKHFERIKKYGLILVDC